MAAYLSGAEKPVRDEAGASKDRRFAIASKAIPQRVATGHAVEGLEITHTAADGGHHLKCIPSQARFREGDNLCPNQGDPFSQPKLMVTLAEDRGAELVVEARPPRFGARALRFSGCPPGLARARRRSREASRLRIRPS